jgi:hypothetical protein
MASSWTLFGHSWSLSMQVRMSRAGHEAKRQAAMDMFTQGKHPGNSDENKLSLCHSNKTRYEMIAYYNNDQVSIFQMVS